MLLDFSRSSMVCGYLLFFAALHQEIFLIPLALETDARHLQEDHDGHGGGHGKDQQQGETLLAGPAAPWMCLRSHPVFGGSSIGSVC